MKKLMLILSLFLIPLFTMAQNKEGDKDDFLKVTEYEVRWHERNDKRSSYGQVVLLLEKGPLITLNSSNIELIKLWIDMLRNEKPVYYSRDFKQFWASPITPQKK